MAEKINSGAAHVLVVPLPGQGHLNPMLQFSRRIVSKGLKVTFVVTNFISKLNHLISSSSTVDHSLKFDTISDGFDEGGRKQAGSMEAYLSSLHKTGPVSLKELIRKYQSSSNPIDCVIYEPFVSWALDVAKEFGLFAAAFFTHACAVNYIFYKFYRNMLPGIVSCSPVQIEGLPLLEVLDLPTFIVLPESYPANFKMTMNQFSNMDKADYILVNTFHSLEDEIVDVMSKLCPLLTIGPTIPSIYLDKRIEKDDDYGIDIYTADASISTSWLSAKPAGSVVYVSFGSIPNNVSEKQIEEIAWALKRSNFYFLWVVKTTEETKLPKGFLEEIEHTGLIVNWCPQVKVLANEAVGCFFTHCGWNSTIEAISLGVPMVTLPQWSDQPTNSKFVEDVWKIGIRAKAVDGNGIVKREEIEFCIKEVMGGLRGREMKKNSTKWKELAIEAVSEGGTSDCNINELVSKFIHSKS